MGLQADVSDSLFCSQFLVYCRAVVNLERDVEAKRRSLTDCAIAGIKKVGLMWVQGLKHGAAPGRWTYHYRLGMSLNR